MWLLVLENIQEFAVQAAWALHRGACFDCKLDDFVAFSTTLFIRVQHIRVVHIGRGPENCQNARTGRTLTL